MKKFTPSFALAGLMLLLALSACDDIFEKDLTPESVVLLGPTDQYQTSETNLTFWWQAVDGATHYRLVVVTPRLDSANILQLDTLLTKTSFAVDLPTGPWQWCVQASNSAYKTNYFCRDITIVE